MLQVEDKFDKKMYIFPVHRWIEIEKQYFFYEFDAFLPQHDKHPEFRKMEMARKRKAYNYRETIKNGPKQVIAQFFIFIELL